jgi:hypothetical protein
LAVVALVVRFRAIGGGGVPAHDTYLTIRVVAGVLI